MDADGLPIVGAGINLAEVDPINAKRMLAFLNHFIVHTASFLNRFSVICEEKLQDLSVRLQRLETTVCLLEAKLSSIPGLDDITGTQPPVSAAVTPSVAMTTSVNNTDVTNNTAETIEPSPVTSDETPASTEPSANSAANDPQYAKYFRLLQLRVPKEALQQRMVIEGLDPNVLDSPNAPVTPATAAPSVVEKPQQHDSDSDVEFSDDDKQSTSSGSDFT